MIWIYIFIIIWSLFLLYLIYIEYKYINNLKSGNIECILSLDKNNVLNFSLPIKSYINKYEIYKFDQNVKVNDLMTGIYYTPGFKPIICNNEEEFKRWKNKLNTYKKILDFENEEFEKYKILTQLIKYDK